MTSFLAPLSKGRLFDWLDRLPPPEALDLAAGLNQNRLFFMHVPKTGGESVRAFLRDIFPNDKQIVCNSRGDLMDCPPSRLAAARVVMGHMPLDTCELLGEEARVITVLRHPVARVMSHFMHIQSRPKADLHMLMHSEGVKSIEDFIRHPAFAKPARNFQTTLLARSVGFLDKYQRHHGGLPLGKLAGHLPDGAEESKAGHRIDLAMARLERVDVVGITDQLEPFLGLIAQRWGFPQPMDRIHVNRARPSSLNELAPSSIIEEMVLEANQNDLVLYEKAQERFYAVLESEANEAVDRLESKRARVPNHMLKKVFNLDINGGIGLGWGDVTVSRHFPDFRTSGPTTKSLLVLPVDTSVPLCIKLLLGEELPGILDTLELYINGRPVPFVAHPSLRYGVKREIHVDTAVGEFSPINLRLEVRHETVRSSERPIEHATQKGFIRLMGVSTKPHKNKQP